MCTPGHPAPSFGPLGRCTACLMGCMCNWDKEVCASATPPVSTRSFAGFPPLLPWAHLPPPSFPPACLVPSRLSLESTLAFWMNTPEPAHTAAALVLPCALYLKQVCAPAALQSPQRWLAAPPWCHSTPVTRVHAHFSTQGGLQTAAKQQPMALPELTQPGQKGDNLRAAAGWRGHLQRGRQAPGLSCLAGLSCQPHKS